MPQLVARTPLICPAPARSVEVGGGHRAWPGSPPVHAEQGRLIYRVEVVTTQGDHQACGDSPTPACPPRLWAPARARTSKALPVRGHSPPCRWQLLPNRPGPPRTPAAGPAQASADTCWSRRSGPPAGASQRALNFQGPGRGPPQGRGQPLTPLCPAEGQEGQGLGRGRRKHTHGQRARWHRRGDPFLGRERGAAC